MSRFYSYRFSVCLYFLAAPAVLAALLLTIFWKASPAAAQPDGRESAAAAFLAGFGWTADPASCEQAEVLIPERFGEVYRQYNELQRSQGFDLSPYRGMRAARFTFALAEFPGTEGTGPVRANVLFVGEEIVAADICAVGAGGFIRGVARQEGTGPAAERDPRRAEQ